MTKEYHYVVVFNDNDKTFSVSEEMCYNTFSDENIYDTEKEEWQSYLDNTDEAQVGRKLERLLKTYTEV